MEVILYNKYSFENILKMQFYCIIISIIGRYNRNVYNLFSKKIQSIIYKGIKGVSMVDESEYFTDWKCCGNCFHFDHSANKCGCFEKDQEDRSFKKWKSKYTCENWVFDELYNQKDGFLDEH